MFKPKILVLAGSNRTGSINSKLASAFVAELVTYECEVTHITLLDYELPLYDGDLESKSGTPKNAEKLAKLFAAHQGVIIVSPEYNGSLTPLLKNSIDWMSRVKKVAGVEVSPFKGKVGLIAAASPGGLGALAGLSHLRDILVRLKMLIISEQVSVSNSATAYDDEGKLTNERQAQMLKDATKSLVEKATSLV